MNMAPRLLEVGAHVGIPRPCIARLPGGTYSPELQLTGGPVSDSQPRPS
jgi:hypothetical protein